MRKNCVRRVCFVCVESCDGGFELKVFFASLRIESLCLTALSLGVEGGDYKLKVFGSVDWSFGVANSSLWFGSFSPASQLEVCFEF